MTNKSIVKITLKDVFSSFQYNSWLKLRIFLCFRIQRITGTWIWSVFFFLTFELLTIVVKYYGTEVTLHRQCCFSVKQFIWRKWLFSLQGCEDGSRAVWINALVSMLSWHCYLHLSSWSVGLFGSPVNLCTNGRLGVNGIWHIW